jgi:phytoene synthase
MTSPMTGPMTSPMTGPPTGPPRALTVEQAYKASGEITRHEAKNFAYGIQLLPKQKRQAMSALYAFARRIDDVGDGVGSAQEKLVGLAGLRESVGRIARREPIPTDPIEVSLADASSRFPLQPAALLEIIEGCEMDCAGTIYNTFDELLGYCGRVAGAVGRLSVAVFGSRPAPTGTAESHELANVLGAALQMTNILRDILEDRDELRRLYLPVEDLERFGFCAAGDFERSPEAFAELVHLEAGRTRLLYAEGLSLLPRLDHRSRACVAAMAGIYRQLLERIDAEPAAVLSRRVSLRGREKLAVAGFALLGRRP